MENTWVNMRRENNEAAALLRAGLTQCINAISLKEVKYIMITVDYGQKRLNRNRRISTIAHDRVFLTSYMFVFMRWN